MPVDPNNPSSSATSPTPPNKPSPADNTPPAGNSHEEDLQSSQGALTPVDLAPERSAATSTSPLTPSIFINMSGPNMSGPGTTVAGVRKHKQRSDAGKKRGPHKKQTSASS
ncbi:hypothetical protein C0993_005054, partial [Termitomyces sp. T159_Od127]